MLEVVSGTKEQRSDEEMSYKSRLSRNDDKKETFFSVRQLFYLYQEIFILSFFFFAGDLWFRSSEVSVEGQQQRKGEKIFSSNP